MTCCFFDQIERHGFHLKRKCLKKSIFMFISWHIAFDMTRWKKSYVIAPLHYSPQISTNLDEWWKSILKMCQPPRLNASGDGSRNEQNQWIVVTTKMFRMPMDHWDFPLFKVRHTIKLNTFVIQNSVLTDDWHPETLSEVKRNRTECRFKLRTTEGEKWDLTALDAE